MKIFYLDTSSNFLYTAIVSNGKLIGEIKLKLDKDLSSFTLPKIKELFDDCKLKPNDIDRIMVVNGPGSFTGIRIGVAIAKVMAWSLKKKVITISSLEAMATSCLEEGYVIPVINARRGYVYGAIYNESRDPLVEEQYIYLDNLLKMAETLRTKYSLTSNDEINTDLPVKAYIPNILKIVDKYQDKIVSNIHFIEPNYLKLTEAEETKKKDERRDN